MRKQVSRKSLKRQPGHQTSNSIRDSGITLMVSAFKGQGEQSLYKDGAEKVQKDCNLCSGLEFTSCCSYYLPRRAVASVNAVQGLYRLSTRRFYYLMLPFHMLSLLLLNVYLSLCYASFS